MKRFAFEGRTALITGAGGGIGRALAGSLARRGCHLALADINEGGLEETAHLIAANGRVSLHRLDVADRAAIAALPEAIEGAHGGLDLLVNNAGVALGGTFSEVGEADFDWVFAINFEGVVCMTRAFLPLLERSDQAQLVNISSLFGLIAPAGQTAYAASKFAVRGFSEALRQELLAARSTVGVTTVHPGGIKTGIAANARSRSKLSDTQLLEQQRRIDKALKMPPERAAEIIVQAIAERRPRVIVGGDAKFAALVERLMPVGYWRILGRTL